MLEIGCNSRIVMIPLFYRLFNERSQFEVFVFDIIFQFNAAYEDNPYALIDYYCALSGNNQIIFETLNISENSDCRTARVTTPYMDSLEEKYNNPYVNEALSRLLPHLKNPIEIDYVGKDFTFNDDCSTGTEAEFYVLCIHPHMRDFSPIVCGNSKRNIPYYLLSPLTEKTLSELTSWETSYAAYDRLFYATGIGEISAHKMMCNISSKLNQKGQNVCRMLEKELNKPVYYYLYRFYGRQPKTCPLCGGEWKQLEDSSYNYKCDVCKIVADKTANE